MAAHSADVTPGAGLGRDMDYLPHPVPAQEGGSRDPHQPEALERAAPPARTRAEEGRSRAPYEPEPLERPTWPVEPGRYRLVAAKACPWATRALIVRQLLGLEEVISLGLAGPTHDERSWSFTLDPGGRDPVLGIERLQEAYLRRDPSYDKGITVPAVVEVDTGQVVTNDFPWITHDLFFEWREHHRPDAPDLWPEDAREEMDEVMQRVFTEVNNGVYRC